MPATPLQPARAGASDDPSVVDLAAVDLTQLDLFERGFPQAVFTRLREVAPVWWHPPTETTPDGEGFWVVSRHADILAIFLDPVRFSSHTGGTRRTGGTFIQDTAVAGVMLNMMDDPRHARIRQLVNKGFTPRTIGALEDDLRRRAREILTRVGAAGECDFVRDVARDLPLQAICMLLGVPQADRDTLCNWIDRGLEYDGRMLGEQNDESRTAAAKLSEYARDLIAEKRARPGDDVLSIVTGATLPDEEESRLSDAELVVFFHLMFAAGSETTRKTIAGGLFALLERPDELARLRAAPRRLPVAVEEMVRWTTPSVYKRRTATCDVELHGQTIRAGDKVTVWEMSANRDAAVFRDPFEFDPGRDPNPHLGFGHGVHYCLGANLARLEIRLLFEELFAHWGAVELAGEPAYTRDNRLFGLKHMPVRFETATAR